MNKVSIFWFRRDLRLEDNAGLYHALKSGFPVIPIFIFDKNILKKLTNKSDQRLQFIHDSLKSLKEQLNTKGSDLLTFYDSPKNAWRQLTELYDIQGVYTNEDYEPYAIKRDKEISTFLGKQSIDILRYKDQCIFHKDDILKKDGKPYTVFTPYKRKWREALEKNTFEEYGSKKLLKNFAKLSKVPMISIEELGFNEIEVQNKVKTIKRSIIEKYHENRDIPSVNGTSLLGLHLRFGTVSVRKCANVGFSINDTWLDELIWREFFMQILYHFPKVISGPFKEKYNALKWKNDKKEFEKWCKGETGYPIVDAGMRQLNETGFMHNRVRMAVGSFLVKHLLIDWKWGEKYFADRLLDFELSANNGNWQWVAGTGCDSAPYFRIFNPYLQQKRFDPDFKYIKRWIPEYGTDKYPSEMVEHKFAYQRALSFYKEALSQ
jgi:deoxyribodipyrimidine photo-lyase